MPAEAWRELVSPKVGVIRGIAPQVRGAQEPLPPYLYTATLSNFDFRTVDKQERLAAGKGRTEEEAKAAAVGEAIERYCAYHWDPHKTFVAKLAGLTCAAITPPECVLYSDAQYAKPDWRYRRWSDEDAVTWLPGVELPMREPVALPAALAYLAYPVPRAEDFFAPATSNGLAAGPTLYAAILSGLYELIERDALLITWMNRLPAIEIDLGEAGGHAGSIVRHYACFDVTVRAFLMRTDLPASAVLAMALDDDPRRPATVVGMGCHLDPAIALDKALFELCQGRPSEARRFTERPPRGRLRTYEDVHTLDDHAAYVSLPERRHEFEFLWASGEKLRIGEISNPSRDDVDRDLETCVAAVTGRGHRVAYAELTTSDIAPYGIHVARTIATGLQPIHFGWGEERLGGRRLFELPFQLGFAPAVRTEADLNPCPHPMA